MKNIYNTFLLFYVSEHFDDLFTKWNVEEMTKYVKVVKSKENFYV